MKNADFKTLNLLSISYNHLLYHIVITPWRREAIINKEHERLLYKFIYDISMRQGAKIWRIGGMPDHVHILCELPTKLSVAAFAQHIKSESSKYLKLAAILPIGRNGVGHSDVLQSIMRRATGVSII